MRIEKIDLIPCPKNKGFYLVPGNEKYSVNVDGDVYDSSRDMFILNKDQINRTTYITCGRFFVHTLMCETFLCKSHFENKETLLPNHINGIKSDNKLSNLEWSTYSSNSIHAYKTGLRKDNITILAKNIKTNEIKSFYSLQECARYFSVNGSIIFTYLKRSNSNMTFKNDYILIKEGNDWPIINPDTLIDFYDGNKNEMFVIDTVTKKAFIYSTYADVCRHLGISSSLFTKKIKKMKNKGKKSFKTNDWEIMPLKNAESWMLENAENKKVTKEIDKSWIRKRKPVPIVVKNLITDKEKTYSSSEEFCKVLGVKKNTFQKHIYVNKGIWQNNFLVKYLNE